MCLSHAYRVRSMAPTTRDMTLMGQTLRTFQLPVLLSQRKGLENRMPPETGEAGPPCPACGLCAFLCSADKYKAVWFSLDRQTRGNSCHQRESPFINILAFFPLLFPSLFQR